jgi:acyl-coenzyme A thioesterase PaaI-like protein
MTSRSGFSYPGADDRDPRPQVVAARRAADEARRVLDALVASGAPAADLDAAATTLAQLAAQLEPHAPASRYDGGDGKIRLDPGEPRFRAYESHPVAGPSNPLAPPVRLELADDDGNVVGTATYGRAYEGPPGCVHGGTLAAAFDYVLAVATIAAGIPTLTGSLTVRYLRATPLHREVRYEARIERVDGRRVHVAGRGLVGGEVAVEAEGVFVSVDPDRLKRPVGETATAG